MGRVSRLIRHRLRLKYITGCNCLSRRALFFPPDRARPRYQYLGVVEVERRVPAEAGPLAHVRDVLRRWVSRRRRESRDEADGGIPCAILVGVAEHDACADAEDHRLEQQLAAFLDGGIRSGFAEPGDVIIF